MFLININDLPNEINSLCKIFAHDTSLFSKVYVIHKSARELNDDLVKISHWNYQWKMEFNPVPNKQANEGIFSRKTNSNDLSHTLIQFNNNGISKCPHQKCSLSITFPPNALLTIYVFCKTSSRLW